MKNQIKEKTIPFTIRPPESVSDQLSLIAKSYNSSRAELASKIIQVALSRWADFEDFAEVEQ